jgi:hypothetical protein
VRPISEALATLSAHALARLAAADIQTIVDLEDLNEWSLSSKRGIGAKTLHENRDRGEKYAGIRLGPATRQFPWDLNPRRWRR